MNDISVNSAAMLYGKGIFTTIAIRAGVPLFWEKHWRRLTSDAAKVGVDMSAFTEKHVLEETGRQLRDSGVHDGRVRLTFQDERPGDVWPAENGQNTSMSILTGGMRELPTKLSLTASPYRVNTFSPIVGVKSCNYLENLLGIEEARDRGFHEALRINDRGAITGGCMSNVFWLKYGKLHTPHLETGCLPGTTREHIVENLECNEVAMPIDTLVNAEAIFLSSAGIGVIAVNDLDHRTFDPIDHPILHIVPPGR
ncbi:MAG: aminotransferase class IV [Pyrinomonadaceae bacterium]|nr:aminotransferase class IV [Pyrinomonadaceae bacterium]